MVCLFLYAWEATQHLIVKIVSSRELDSVHGEEVQTPFGHLCKVACLFISYNGNVGGTGILLMQLIAGI